MYHWYVGRLVSYVALVLNVQRLILYVALVLRWTFSFVFSIGITLDV